MGTTIKAGIPSQMVQRVAPCSVRGQWIIAHDDARTTQTSLDVGSITDSAFHWVEVPDGATRVLVRGLALQGTSAVATSPAIRLIGVYGHPESDGTLADQTPVMRLDTADADGAAVTVTLTDGTTVLNDGFYDYGDVTTIDGYDLKGAWYVGTPVQTASSTTPDAATFIQLLFIN